MRILILGGSAGQRGGVEAFCARAKQAIEQLSPDVVEHQNTDTAFLSLRKLPGLARGFYRLARQRRRPPDCVWLQYSNLPDLFYLPWAKLLGFKVLVTPHLGANWRSQSNPMLRTLSQRLLGLSDRLGLLSHTQETELAFPPDVPRSYLRTFLAACVISGEHAPRRPEQKPLRLAHVSRLSEGKGTFHFVEVCRLLRDRGIPFTATIAGGADRATLERLDAAIEASGLGAHIEMVGSLAEPDYARLLASTDILVHLSTVDSYPLIVIEAIACAAFPICIDLPGAAYMVGTYAGHVVPEQNCVTETADFITRTPLAELRSDMEKAMRHARADYGWSACVASLDAVMRETVEEAPGERVAAC